MLRSRLISGTFIGKHTFIIAHIFFIKEVLHNDEMMYLDRLCYTYQVMNNSFDESLIKPHQGLLSYGDVDHNHLTTVTVPLLKHAYLS